MHQPSQAARKEDPEDPKRQDNSSSLGGLPTIDDRKAYNQHPQLPEGEEIEVPQEAVEEGFRQILRKEQGQARSDMDGLLGPHQDSFHDAP